jgi:hypothetical protein
VMCFCNPTTKQCLGSGILHRDFEGSICARAGDVKDDVVPA